MNTRKPNFLKEKEKEGRKKIQKNQGDKIKLTNLTTNEIKYFPSRVTASRWLGKNDSYITSILSNNKNFNKEALGWKIESISLKEYEEAIKNLPEQIFEERPTKMSAPKIHPKEIIQGNFNPKNYKKVTNRTDNFKIPFILNNYPLLSMSQKIVYSMILYYLEDGEKTTTVSSNKMNEDFNMARGTINQNLRFLAENGFIKIEYFGDANNTREITLLKDIRENQPEWDE